MNQQITRNDIKKTETYKGLDHIQQKLLMRKNNVRLIENGVNISNNIGYEKWIGQTPTSYHVRAVVKEFIGE